jgi:MFS family permease
MRTLAHLIIFFTAVSRLVGRLRENRRRGVPFNWTAVLATAGGVIALMALSGACLAGAIALGWPILGVILSLAVFIAGLVALALAVTRRWPPHR